MTDPDSCRVEHLKQPAASPAPVSLDVDIVEEAGDWSGFQPTAAAINAAVEALLSEPSLDVGRATATIALGDDERVRHLNRDYRGRDKPTNVLSFPAAAPLEPEEPTFLGDIILAVETITAEAADQGVPPRHHLQHLVVHGLLHLLGFDHESTADAEEMEGLETAILARLGIADPYGDAVLEPTAERGDA